MDLSYEQTISYLDNLYRHPAVPSRVAGLRRAERLLAAVGNPHRAFRSVHVAGSCGKGSTTTMIGSVLMLAGVHTGLFRSPHLQSYTERVSIGAEDIEEPAWARLFNHLLPAVEAMRDGEVPDYDLGRPTVFEILFALACLYFAESGVEWVVAEAGLGGRLDATNLLQPDVAVVTNIHLEHTQILGDSLTAIAGEKAAIIKPGAAAVTAATGEALAVIEARAEAVRAPLARVGREILVDDDDLNGELIRISDDTLRVQTRLRLAGTHQPENAALAFGAISALRRRGVSLDGAAIEQGLGSARLAGRLEFVAQPRPVLLDGAHNGSAMEALALSLEAGKLDVGAILFAAMDDKDIDRMARAVGNVPRVVVTAVPDTQRSANPERVAEAFARAGNEVELVADPARAYERASMLAGSAPLLVTGSLYLVGFVRSLLQGASVL